MISSLNSLILGIIEGFTEFLPISSTAHLVLASKLLKIPFSNFTKTFEIAIQSGAILAVVALYWRKFLDFKMLKKVAVAFLPTALIGFAFYGLIKNYLLESMTVILASLAIGGIAMIFFDRLFKKNQSGSDLENITYGQAVKIGFFQSIAMIPGISRAAATIIGGMLLGIQKQAIVEFSFLLAVPTMLAATSLDLLKNFGEFSANQMGSLAIGFVVSFIMAIISIKFLLSYLKKHSFFGFGIYRIILVIIFIVFWL